MKDQKCHFFKKNESIFASGCNIAIIASVIISQLNFQYRPTLPGYELN